MFSCYVGALEWTRGGRGELAEVLRMMSDANLCSKMLVSRKRVLSAVLQLLLL